MAEIAIGVEVAVDGDDITSANNISSAIWLSLISDTTIAQRLASMTKCARPKRLKALLAND
jgi:hypothetical protein